MSDDPDVEFIRNYELQQADGGRSAIHAYYLIGPKGTVQFKYMDRPKGLPGDPRDSAIWPLAVDLGYHSPIERFPNQYRTDSCPYMAATLRRFPCFYDGSALDAELPLQVLREHGEDKLWAVLRNHYQQVFESDEYINGFGEWLVKVFGAGAPPE